MKVKIHRGAHEIGGSCVEVEHEGQRIVLDVGLPLNVSLHDVIPIPEVKGLNALDPSLLGVIISHAHQDHWGLVPDIFAGVPVYMGAATSRILTESAFWTKGLSVKPAGFLEHRQPFTLGPFRITPYLNDHSAFDAYSLLVEAGGRSLFYTGDIRGHGRKAGIFEQLIRQPPTGVNVLLMEGTNIRPDASGAESQESETDVELAMAETMKATDGMVLTVFSAQNIDRLVTIYRAALRANRDLVIDLYTASIVRATGNKNIPQPGSEWPRVHVFVPLWQRVKVKDAEEFQRVEEIREWRVYPEWLATNRARLVTMFSVQSGPALAKANCLDLATLIWSLWAGYLPERSGTRLRTFLEQHNIPLVQHHTSGHASVADLSRLANALAPDRIVPIHSFGSHRFSEHFPNVAMEEDGAWWDV
jgi:ribonuclease J